MNRKVTLGSARTTTVSIPPASTVDGDERAKQRQHSGAPAPRSMHACACVCACVRRALCAQVLLNLVLSGSYQAEFVDLNERLSAAYNDLGLALQIHSVSQSVGRSAMARAGASPQKSSLAGR